MKVPLRIYFDKENGSVIQTTGNYNDEWLLEAPNIAYEVSVYSTLSERNRDTFDVIELPFGAYAQDFAEAIGYRVNPETKELEFTYPDPNEPEAPREFVKPLTEQVRQLQTDNGMIALQLADAETKNIQLQDDMAKLTMQLAMKGVI